MAVHVREREPAQLLRRAEGSDTYEPYLTLTGRRFMGTLLHPVSRGDMLRQFGVFCSGLKVIVDWPVGTNHCPVQKGDRLEIAEHSYPVVGCVERPGCYLDIYVEEI